jgi:hypothetical protein
MNFYPLIIASSSNMTNFIASSAVELQYKWGYAIQALYNFVTPIGATPNGQLNLRGSNDIPANLPYGFTPTNWTNITGTTAIINSTSGTVMWDTQFANYRWVQMIWQPSSSVASSGLLTAIANVKGV